MSENGPGYLWDEHCGIEVMIKERFSDDAFSGYRLRGGGKHDHLCVHGEHGEMLVCERDWTIGNPRSKP